jgi:hypothetical protein
MRFLKQTTAITIHLGPLVDATDGFTLETGLTASTSDVDLWKAGALSPLDISGRTFTHRGNGIYTVTLLASDVDTAGMMVIHTHIPGARPVQHEFMVLPATTYDAMVTGTPLPADMTRIAGNATAATLATFGFLGIKNFTVQTGSTTSRVVTNLTESVSDHWNGRTVVFISGALAGQASTITDYNGSTKELVVNTLTAAPTAGDIAVIV